MDILKLIRNMGGGVLVRIIHYNNVQDCIKIGKNYYIEIGNKSKQIRIIIYQEWGQKRNT
jgi:hypothetical protein